MFTETLRSVHHKIRHSELQVQEAFEAWERWSELENALPIKKGSLVG